MTRTTIIFAVALQACGPRSSESEQPGESADRPERAPNERTPNERAAADPGPNCPARFDGAMQGSTCAQVGHCVYPEAECWCAVQQECTGVDKGPEQQMWLEWSCRVTDPSVRRPDGCPAKVPEQGQSCGQDGQVCHWSPHCGGIQSTARCTGGAWQLKQVEVSAPPSVDG
jgi:hypothetical protein